MLTSIILMLLLVSGEPADAGAAPQPAPAAAAPPAAKTAAERDAERDAEVVCVTVTPTGSLFSQKVCHSRKQWKRIEAKRRRGVEDAMEPGGETRGGRRE